MLAGGKSGAPDGTTRAGARVAGLQPRAATADEAGSEEVAQMTLSLALPAASFVTGVALPVDGGLTVRRA